MFFRPLSEESCGAGVGRRRTYHRVECRQLAEVLQLVQAAVHALLQLFPRFEVAQQLLVVHHGYANLALRVAGEDELHIGSHWQQVFHQVVAGGQSHQCQQAEECGVVAEAQRCAVAAAGNHLVGFLFDILPERHRRAGADAFGERRGAVHQVHALVVGVVDSLHLLGGEPMPETDVERHVLHVAGYGVQLGEQLQGLLHLAGVFEELGDETVGDYVGLTPDAGREVFQFSRLMVEVAHVAGVGLRSHPQCGA